MKTSFLLLIACLVLACCSCKAREAIGLQFDQALQLARGGHLSAALEIVDSLPDINARDSSGATILCVACNEDVPEFVNGLLERKANPNSKNSDGETPLHVAVSRPEFEKTVRLLLSHGADPNLGAQNGWTPLHFAANACLPNSAAILISNGASASSVDSFGQTPLHIACSKGFRIGSFETAQVLLKAGADGGAKDHRGFTPLDYVRGEIRNMPWGEEGKPMMERLKRLEELISKHRK